MKVNLNQSLKGLDGIEMPNGNIGKIIANVLVNTTKGDPIKYWGWALKLTNGEELDLDKSDFDTLKEFIKNTEQLPIITKAQSLLLFKEE